MKQAYSTTHPAAPVRHRLLLAAAIGASLALTGCGELESLLNSDDNTGTTPTTATVNFDQQVYLKAANADPGDKFGLSLALSGDGTYLAVGAGFEQGDASSTMANPNDASTEVGAVYVFKRQGDGWVQQAYLKAANAEIADRFGWSLAFSHDASLLAVGALFESGDAQSTMDQPNNNAPHAGAVYLFERSGESWTQTAYLKASNADASDGFGLHVALSADGNTLAVSSYLEDGDAQSTVDQPNDNVDQAGAVYVFTRDSQGAWHQQAYLKAPNPSVLDRFGEAIDLSDDGTILVVSAELEDGDAHSSLEAPNDNALDAGAVYVFERQGDTWTLTDYLKAPNAGAGDRFGSDIALFGDTLAIGAVFEAGDADSTLASPNDNATDAGAVYIYTRENGTWAFQAYLKAPNIEAGDRFGATLDLRHGVLAVASRFEAGSAQSTLEAPDNLVSGAGAVYVYTGQINDWTLKHYLKAANADYLDQLGFPVTLSGDALTLAAGAWEEDGDASSTLDNPNDAALNAGAVYVFH